MKGVAVFLPMGHLRPAARNGDVMFAVLRMIWWLAACALPLYLAACGLSGPAYESSAGSGAAAIVDMTNTFAFEPSVVRIKAGQTVEWRNKSLVTHTVTDDPLKASNPNDTSLPTEAEPFSAQVPAGEVYRHTFRVPGTYRYFCTFHEGLDMRGQVTVEPGT
jgi:plastocyanin